MTTTIALAGKGGVGKTTISALLINYLVKHQDGAVLAIDADPSSNLNMALGLELEWTVGDIREDLLNKVKDSLTAGGAAMGTIDGGMTKQAYLDYEIRTSISEGDYFDMIAMGRSEGQGCYCAVNHNLRQVIDSISKNYRYVVIDNEAGMEHLSRRTTRDVQHLIVVTDPSMRGIVAAERIASFRNSLDIHIEQVHLVVNRVVGELPQPVLDKIADMGIPLLGTVSADPEIGQLDILGEPLVRLPPDSIANRDITEMLSKIL